MRSALRCVSCTAFVLAACSGGEKPLSPEQRVDRLELTPSSSQLVIPSVTSLRVEARALDRAGAAVPGVALTWRASNASVVEISPGSAHAIITAIAPGTATVTVTAGSVVAAVEVQVALAPVSRVDVVLSATLLGVGESVTASARAFDNLGNLLAGRTAQWSSSDPTIASVSSTGVITGMGAGESVVSATVEGMTGAAAVRVVSSAPNLVVENVLLTQAVQRPDGSIPLVANGHPVLLSVFGTLDRPFTSTTVPRVRIVVFQGATQVLTDERPMTASAGPSWDYGAPIHQVVLPSSISQPGLRVLVTVNPAGNPAEATLSDNVWPANGQPKDVSVRTVPTLPIHLVPVFLSNGGSTGTVTPATLPEYLFATRQFHPVSSIATTIGSVFSTDVVFGDGQSSAWTAILQQLDLVRVSEGSQAYYVGAIRPPPGVTFVQFGGFAYIPFNPQSSGPSTRTALVVGVGWFNRARHTTELVAHELGHTMGRRHAPCGGAAGPDPLYPHQSAAIGVYGYDLYSYSLNPSGLPIAYGPTAASDVMSYCTPAWISDYNYEALLNVRSAVTPVLAAGTQAAGHVSVPGRECECVIVWGAVEGETVHLQPSFRMRTRVALPAQPGPVSLVGESRDGRRLFHYDFEAAELDHAPGVRHFAFAIPVEEGAGAVLDRITVRYRNRAASITPRAARGDAGVSIATRARVDLRRRGVDAIELSWEPSEAPIVVVRDPMTQRVLAIGMTGRMLVRTLRSELDVNVSDGITSSVSRLRATLR